MLRHLFGTFLAALLIWVAQGGMAQAAPQWHSYCPDAPSQQELARRMEESVRIKPDGTRRLDKCYATPVQFLHSFRQVDPDAVKDGRLDDVTELGAYVKWLVPRSYLASMEYVSACVKGLSSGIEDVKLDCEQRTLKRGETLLVNPTTGKPILMGNCANPVVREAEQMTVTPECVVARIPVDHNDTGVRLIVVGAPTLPEESVRKCLAYKRPGDTAFTYRWPEECRWGTWTTPGPGPDGTVVPWTVNCSVGNIVAFLRKPLERKGGLQLKEHVGFVEVQLPAEFAREGADYQFVVCIEEGPLRHSLGMATTWDDFQRPPGDSNGLRRMTFPQPVFSGQPGQKITATR